MTEPTGGHPGTTPNQQALEKHKDRFRRSNAGADEFLQFLRRSDVGVWRIQQDTVPSQWWINVTLPEHQEKIFGLNREIQVLYTEFQNVHPRALSVIQSRVRRDMRVEPDLAILISRDSNAKDIARRRAGEMAIIAINLNEISAGDSPLLHTLIAQSVATVDHFDVAIPVREPSGFYGRQAEIETIANDLKRAVSVGIFGLRKAGKTSLLNALDTLRSNEERNATVRVDVSEIITAEQFRTTVLEGLWAQVRSLPGNENIQPRLRSLTRQGARRVDLVDSATSWIQDLRVLLENVEAPAVLIIDEIDQAFPSRSNLDPDEAQSLFRSLVQLRSLIQEQEHLALLCAGVDPALFERPLVDGKDNLLYKLVRLVWLAPMTRDEIAEMVRSLGKRMGVRIRGHQEIDALYARYGGHPLLTRKACSIAASERKPDDLPFHITTDVLEKAMTSRIYGGPQYQAADVLESFTEWFPEESALMRLHFSPDSDEQDLAALLLRDNPNAMVHCIAYGLCYPNLTARIAAAIESLDR
ncbi:AAA-like domain-containing protein [Pseudarthrobacter oxydans]|uniref:nSTAND1 domain-containing NTPase n=1 Tax=Pseudarthrobacter oxydans TaxID=1671 RepID=UPI001574D8ED|nr:AAA family ATPase [Pseudarthrobacter oxydans]NSX35556.1 AAA-like domain-containing protein [Pseudarthrobacter oxydans]